MRERSQDRVLWIWSICNAAHLCTRLDWSSLYSRFVAWFLELMGTNVLAWGAEGSKLLESPSEIFKALHSRSILLKCVSFLAVQRNSVSNSVAGDSESLWMPPRLHWGDLYPVLEETPVTGTLQFLSCNWFLWVDLYHPNGSMGSFRLSDSSIEYAYLHNLQSLVWCRLKWDLSAWNTHLHL